MCLIIHKPQGVSLPRELLQSAADYNRDGFGIMALANDGNIRVVKRSPTRLPELLEIYQDFADAECVIHLRARTHGAIDGENTHPFGIAEHLYVMHNGTLDIDCHVTGRSDSWHLVQEYLRPTLSRHTHLIHNPLFMDGLRRLIGGGNRLVFMDGLRRRTVIVNRERGIELQGLWLSNTRWLDAERFGLAPAHPRVPPLRARQLFYC